MKDVKIVAAYDLHANVDALWPVVSDTNRFNKLFGLPSVSFKAERRAKGRGLIRGSSMQMGQEQTWEEHPFEWVEGRRWSVLRTYDKGPFYELRVSMNLAPTGPDATHVEIALQGVPRSALIGPLLTVTRGLAVKRWGGMLEAMATFARGAAKEVDAPIPYAADPAVVAAAQPAREALIKSGFDAALVDALVNLVASRPDWELGRMRPYTLTPALHCTRMDALRLCLFATRHGLLSLSWDLLCPHCRGAKVQAPTLAGVSSAASCDSCGIQFDVEFDRNVEVTFSPSPAIRKVDTTQFCSGGPAVTPHVRVQQELAPGESRTLPVVLAPGLYRVRASGVPGSSLMEVGMKDGNPAPHALDAAGSTTITVDPVAVNAEPGHSLPSNLQLTLSNASGEGTVVVVENSAWMDEAATAAAVTALQDFKDLFGKEVLATGQNIRVGQVTLMFTDLKGSTALYEEVGDVRAYALVQDHFKMLTACIREFHGSIVKTIGDAVMAVFDKPVDAVQCALEIQRRAKSLKGDDGRDVIIKIGAHCGPCLAVEQNDKLDYFGNMVNVAARAQNESVGWDVVLTQAMLQDVQVKTLVVDIPAEPFDTILKGIRGTTQLLRVWPVGKGSPSETP